MAEEGKVAELKEKMANVKQKAQESLASTGEFVKDKAKVVDDRVHNNPWPVVGGVFVSGLLLGYILGKSK